jgi:Na+-translocating ferredoxin:NAD+ oxidoreductase RnfC subunit
VRPGERVSAGQPLGEVPEKALGAILHAPFDATVAEVSEQHLILTR